MVEEKCFTKQEKGEEAATKCDNFFCCEHANKHAKLVDVTFQEGKRKKVRMMNDCETGTSAGDTPETAYDTDEAAEAEAWWLLSDNVNVRERLEVLSHLIQNLSDGDLKKIFAVVPKWVATKIASEPLTPTSVLVFLARYGPEEAQWRVAINRNTPLPIVEELIGSPSSVVSDVAARHVQMRTGKPSPHIT